MTTPPTPEWLTIRQAVARSGKSIKTIRRRIDDEALIAQRDPDSPNAPWMIRADSLDALYGIDGAARPADTPAGGRGALVLARDADAYASLLTDQINRADRLADELAAVKAKLAAAEMLVPRWRRKRLDNL